MERPAEFTKYEHTFQLESAGDRSVGIQPYYNEAKVTISFRYPELEDNGCTETVKEQLTEAIREALNTVLATD